MIQDYSQEIATWREKQAANAQAALTAAAAKQPTDYSAQIALWEEKRATAVAAVRAALDEKAALSRALQIVGQGKETIGAQTEVQLRKFNTDELTSDAANELAIEELAAAHAAELKGKELKRRLHGAAIKAETEMGNLNQAKEIIKALEFLSALERLEIALAAFLVAQEIAAGASTGDRANSEAFGAFYREKLTHSIKAYYQPALEKSLAATRRRARLL